MQVFELAGLGSPLDDESNETECEFKLVVDDDELSLWNLGLVDIFYLASWIRYKMVVILATILLFMGLKKLPRRRNTKFLKN